MSKQQHKISNNMGFFNLFSSHRETSKQPQQHEAQLQSAMFANLSQTQKFAMVAMLASLAAAPASAERTAMAQKMLSLDVKLMGITQGMVLNYAQTQTKPNAQTVISTLKTITDTNVLEWLIYGGFGIIAVNQNEKACYVFYDWCQQLGYDPDEVHRIVKKTEEICNRMSQFDGR